MMGTKTSLKETTIYGQHYPRAVIDHSYDPRKERGRGLMQIEGAYIGEIMKFM
jgi:hypothetical protein